MKKKKIKYAHGRGLIGTRGAMNPTGSIPTSGSIKYDHLPFYLLKKGLTTPDDLRKIAEMLGFKIDYIGFGYNFPLIKDSSKLCILNIGNRMIGGTHWVAVNNETREYFDPLGVMPDYDYIPKEYTNNDHLPVQDWRYGGCGQYCVLWLYYSNLGKREEFFKLFQEPNIE